MEMESDQFMDLFARSSSMQANSIGEPMRHRHRDMRSINLDQSGANL